MTYWISTNGCRSGVELPSSFNGDETEESSSSSMD